MQIACSACNGPTKEKTFTNKFNTLTTVYECLSGCMTPDGRYPLGTFPPRNRPGPAVRQTPITAGQAVASQKQEQEQWASMAQSLKEIATILRLWKEPLEKEARNETF